MADHHLTPLCTCQLRSVWCRQRYFSRLLIKVMKRDSPSTLSRSTYFSPNTVSVSCDTSCWTTCFTSQLEESCSMSKLWKRYTRTSSTILTDDSIGCPPQGQFRVWRPETEHFYGEQTLDQTTAGGGLEETVKVRKRITSSSPIDPRSEIRSNTNGDPKKKNRPQKNKPQGQNNIERRLQKQSSTPGQDNRSVEFLSLSKHYHTSVSELDTK